MSLIPAALGLLALLGALALVRALAASQASVRQLVGDRERLLKIVEGTGVGTWEWNVETGAVLINEHCAQMLGGSSSALGVLTLAAWQSFTHPEDVARLAMLLEQHVSGELGAFTCETRVRHKDGHWVWVMTRGWASVRDAAGRARRVSGTHTDISERKRTEALLRDSEALSLSILDSMSAHIAVLDRQGVIIAVNEAWRRFSADNGLESGQIAPGTGVGTSYLSVCRATSDLGSDAEAGPAQAGILAVLEGRLPQFSLEYPCHSPTAQRWFSVSVTPLGADGRGVVVAHTDITERRRADLAVQAQNERLEMNRQVLEAVSEAILVKGPGSKMVWANRAFLDYHGMSADQLQGLVDAPFVEPDLTQQYLREDAQVFSSGHALDIPDEAVVRFDGVVQRWHTVKSPIYDPQGQVIATVGVSRDITHRMEAEAALRASQAIQDAMGRIASIGGWTLELSTQSVQWTEQTYRIHELEPRHSPTWEDGIRCYAPEARPVIAQAMRDSIAKGTGFDLELPFVTAKGRDIWVRAVAEPDFVDGHVVRLYGAIQDITARKQTEQALQKQTERLRIATDSAGIGVWEFDPIRGSLEWDDWMYRMYGASRTDGAAPLELWSKHLHPEDSQRVLAELNAALDGRNSYKPEFRIRRADGELRYVQASARVVRDAAGRPLRMTGVNIDITTQRLSELALREAKQAAEAATAAKSQFLANMSHELRTPMNAILGMLSLLQKTPLTARQADYTDKTEGAARSLLRLLNDTLDFSKIEAGRMSLDPHPFVVGELLQEVAALMSASLGAKPVALRLTIAPEMPQRLVGDAMRLQQVLLNLVGNAIKFTAAGEVVLSMELLRCDEREVTVLVAVRDTGIGMAPENHDRVFGGFSQADASITRRFGGTGLGLAISKELVALMGGELQLDSALGQGSRFHFELTLPLAAADLAGSGERVPTAAARAQRLRPADSQRRLAGLRLLVAEDNADNRQIARELLEGEGAVVCLADDGAQAVAAVAQTLPPFDLVLMDLQMPVMDGYAATRLIRQQHRSQVLPVVAMTANVTAADRHACLAAGMNDHVGKPFDLDHLVGVLRRHTGRPEAQTAARSRLRSALPLAVMEAAQAAGVDILPALHLLGERTDVYEGALRGFVNDLAQLPDRLRGLAEQAEPLAARRALHTVKGLAATLGAATLAGQAALCEQRLTERCEPAGLQGLTDRVIAAACSAIEAAGPGLVALLHAMQSVAEREAVIAMPPAAHDAAAFRSDLQALCVQLWNGDMTAIDSTEALQRRVAGPIGQSLLPLAEAVAALDFEHGLRVCRRLLDSITA